jgi:hypothetical protein
LTWQGLAAHDFAQSTIIRAHNNVSSEVLTERST